MSVERYRGKNWSNYDRNRNRVCEIYGVDPKTAHVHHIVFRHDVVNYPDLSDFDLNQLSNLYPFSEENPAPHTGIKDHEQLHYKVGEMAYRLDYKPKQEKKLKILFERRHHES